jgi:phage recombination protein Bet
MTSTALVSRPSNAALAAPAAAEPAQVVWTEERIRTLKSTLAKDCTPAQFELALSFCQRTGLDPFLKQVRIVVRQGQMTLQIGIDGHRAIALRSGVYAGEEGPLYCGKDGVYTDTWVGADPPTAAKFTIWRHDYDRPFTAVVLFKEFAGLGGQSPLWKSAPIHMLGVRASSHAFRKAFQQELASHGRIARAMGVALESAADPAQELGADQPAHPTLAPPRAALQARVIEPTARPAAAPKPASADPRRMAYLKRIAALRLRLREVSGLTPREAPATATLAELEAFGKALRQAVEDAEAAPESDAIGEFGDPDRDGPFDDDGEPERDGSPEAEAAAAAELESYRRQYETLRSECQALGLDPPELTGAEDLNAVADLHIHWTEQKAAAEDALGSELAGTSAVAPKTAQARARR